MGMDTQASSSRYTCSKSRGVPTPPFLEKGHRHSESGVQRARKRWVEYMALIRG